MAWKNVTTLDSREYKCGFCNFHVASNLGYLQNSPEFGIILICPHCDKPTYFFGYEDQTPGDVPGNDVENVPDEIYTLFTEARKVFSENAYTSSVLLSRKLLMNISVGLGAKEGETFISYVEFLSEKGYIPPNGKGWVDHIRKKGNEATHEIKIMSREDALDLMTFVEMLLKFIYEFPSKITPKS